MPIYEYACPRCHKTFEEWLRSDDDIESQPCPDCGEPSPRIMSNTSFILKGGGWFASSYGHGTSNLADKTNGVPNSSGPAPSSEKEAPAASNDKPAAPAASGSAAKSDTK